MSAFYIGKTKDRTLCREIVGRLKEQKEVCGFGMDEGREVVMWTERKEGQIIVPKSYMVVMSPLDFPCESLIISWMTSAGYWEKIKSHRKLDCQIPSLFC